MASQAPDARSKPVDLDETRELKIRLPVRLVVHLHYVKLTQSRPISNVVQEALEEFFARLSKSAVEQRFQPEPTTTLSSDWLERQLEATQTAGSR